ncbi:MAG: phosphoribosylaminoimidazolesuccinocarboxamide synthase [Bacteroidales bacterium]|nr:phosphoribosylaminoimidazolesuccinocarboxamide synthase [Bacteroidales bacterium]
MKNIREISILMETNFQLANNQIFYRGKVRDIYKVEDWFIMVVTDRISAFDVVLPVGIPYKGQILNAISNHSLDAAQEVVPTWKVASPHPNVTIGKKAEPFKIEIIVRGYLTGSAWRFYKQGGRNLCGNILPEGMVENQPFPKPLITPTTKAETGHDENITPLEIIEQGLATKEEYEQLEAYSLELFKLGSKMARERGLILVDTKYEFGKTSDGIILIDEVHTPDSSRYFYAENFDYQWQNNISPRQLSKEFVREWLMSHGFEGKEGQTLPNIPEEFIMNVSARYQELYQQLLGLPFEPYADSSIHAIEQAIRSYLSI